MNQPHKPMQFEPISMGAMKSFGNPVELPNDLAESLLQAGGSALKAAHGKRLAQLEEALRKRLSSGVTRADYEECEAMLNAIISGRQTLSLLPANELPKPSA